MLKKYLAQATRRFSSYSGLSWQSQKGNSVDKVEKMRAILEKLDCKSILDVGCNAGEVTRLLGEKLFAVGIDQNVDTRGFSTPLHGACLGQMKIDLKNVEKLPVFDAACLLSVHHQWHDPTRDDRAKAMVRAIAEKASRVFFVEFAAINSKYQESSNRLFVDNDEESVKRYGADWLGETLVRHKVTYIGKTAESSHEPYRFMFACLLTQIDELEPQVIAR